MPAGDVWGNTWLNTWNNSWAQTVGPSSVLYSHDGKGKGERKRYLTDELFAKLEQTLYETLHPPQPVVRVGTALAARTTEFDAAMDRLLALAADRHDLSARVTRLQQEIIQYADDRERAFQEDEEEVMLFL